MPGTYRVEPFTAQGPERARGPSPHQKQRRVKSTVGAREAGGVHYGKRFAQTEELIAAKAMNRELEELAGLKPAPARAPKPSPLPPLPQPIAPLTSVGSPIGALPAAEELPTSQALRDLLDSATRQLDAARLALRDLARAGVQLAALPVQAGRLLAQQVRWLSA